MEMATSVRGNKKTTKIYEELPQKLLAWYDMYARVLPWRYKTGQKAEPYIVWLSEVMLQQTTVETVKPYFSAFITRWPSVRDLALADVNDVLYAWQGLGYYARARNMHRCAQEVWGKHEGRFPDQVRELLSLPGIGPYTAAAVSAISFNRRAVAVDGNIERVFARILTLKTPLPALKREIVPLIENFVPEDRPGDYTQALMDLGATICRPKKPACPVCPLSNFCQAYRKGIAETLPHRLPKKSISEREALFYWIEDQERGVLLEKRPEKGLLGGMIGLPSGAWYRLEQDRFDLKTEYQYLERAGAKGVLLDKSFQHIFTHFKLKGHVARCKLIHEPQSFLRNLNGQEIGISYREGKKRNDDGAVVSRKLFWCPIEKLSRQAFPSCMQKAVRLVTGSK